MNELILSQDHLPTLSPDLTVAGQAQSGWRIEQISPNLARQIGVVVESARGRSLGALLGEAVPSLVDLVSEAVSQDRPLKGVPIDLPLGGGRFRAYADLLPLGLSDDFRRQRCAIHLRRLAEEPPRIISSHGLVGQSPALYDVMRKIERYGPTAAAVVITGETGSGKELVAAALHQASPRREQEMIAVNCAAISSELLESELFGHEKGAFTGALRSHRGRFERADGGTLFLDEIGEMPLLTQAKLLRVLESGTIERVGSEQERAVDVRIVCATNVPLEKAVAAGTFRADLYHRLAVLRVHLPPLREREEDIPPLVGHFLQQLNRKYGRRVERLTPEALQLLQAYLWPGNVRELKNVLERVYIETQTDVIGARAFSEWIRERQDFDSGEWDAEPPSRPAIAPPFPLSSDQLLLTDGSSSRESAKISKGQPQRSTRPADLTADAIRRAYRQTAGNLAGAARLLGVHRATLYRYLNKLHLDRNSLDD